MKKQDAINFIITCTIENFEYKDLDTFISETLQEEYSKFTDEELENVLNIYDDEATIDPEFLYFDVHVCGKNGFSTPVKIPFEKIEEGYEDQSIIQFAYEGGLIDVEDRDYVDEVREIEYDEYLQMKGIISEKSIDVNWDIIKSTIENYIQNGDWTAIYELLSFLPEDKLNGFLTNF
jgi:hypothetical protein